MGTWSKDALMQFLQSKGGATQPGFSPTLGPAVNPTVVPGTLVNLPKRDFAPESNAQAQNRRLGWAYDKLASIDNYDTTPGSQYGSDYLERAEDIMFRSNQLYAQAAQNRFNSAVQQPNYPVANNHGGRRSFGNFLSAIAGQESGGNYGSVNSDSGALGKYQIMPSNIAGPGGWDKEALGRNITPEQFLNSPKLQEQIARYKLREYYKRYGIRGAASAWYSGSPERWRENSPQGGYPSVHNYVMDILRKMGLIK